MHLLGEPVRVILPETTLFELAELQNAIDHNPTVAGVSSMRRSLSVR